MYSFVPFTVHKLASRQCFESRRARGFRLACGGRRTPRRAEVAGEGGAGGGHGEGGGEAGTGAAEDASGTEEAEMGVADSAEERDGGGQRGGCGDEGGAEDAGIGLGMRLRYRLGLFYGPFYRTFGPHVYWIPLIFCFLFLFYTYTNVYTNS